MNGIKKPKTLLIAKEINPEDAPNSLEDAIPLSVFKKEMGLSLKKEWKPSKNNILGDWEDYKEMEKLHGEVIEEVPEEKPKPKPKKIPAVGRPKEDSKSRVEALKQEEEQKQKTWLDQLLIFQKYQELREENALENWKRHSIEWNRVEQFVSKKSGKNLTDLLMTRLGEYREKVESKLLIEEALHLLEAENINFWKEGLRIGNDLLGLSFQLPRGGPRQIERLKFPDSAIQKEPKSKQSKHCDSFAEKNDLEHLLKVIDPFHEMKGEYLEAKGVGLSKLNPDLTKAYIERLSRLPTAVTEAELKAEPESKGLATEVHPTGMKLIASTNRMFFENPINQISTSVMTIHNCGSVAMHFEWIQSKRPNPLGIFNELWKLHTMPVQSKDNEIQITLQGVCYEKDFAKKKRDAVDKNLHKRRAAALAKETVEKIWRKFLAYESRTNKPYKDMRKILFEGRNVGLRLSFNETVYQNLVALSHKITEVTQQTLVWDGSVGLLYDKIAEINDVNAKGRLNAELNSLVAESRKIKAGETVLRETILNEMFTRISDKIVETSEALRKEMNLPQVTRELTEKVQNFAETEDTLEEVENVSLNINDAKKGGAAQDPKKNAQAAGNKDPKKAPVPQKGPPPVDPKKGNVRVEEVIAQPKKKTSNLGWSLERIRHEKNYRTHLKALIRSFIFDNIGKVEQAFEENC